MVFATHTDYDKARYYTLTKNTNGNYSYYTEVTRLVKHISNTSKGAKIALEMEINIL